MFKLIFFLAGGFLFAASVSVQAALLCNNSRPDISPTTAHFVDNNDGTVSDPKTGLVWKKCSEGQNWNASTNGCDGGATGYNWKQGLERVQTVNAGGEGEAFGRTNWRLPNIKELQTIFEQKCWNPAINFSVFPSTTSDWYWSSTVFSGDNPRGRAAWGIMFNSEGKGWLNKDIGGGFIRLVRDK